MKLIPDGTKVVHFSQIYCLGDVLWRELGHDEEKAQTPPDISAYVLVSYDLGGAALHLLTEKGKALWKQDFSVGGPIGVRLSGEEEYVVSPATKRKPAVMGRRPCVRYYTYPVQPCPPSLVVDGERYLGFPDHPQQVAGSSKAWREKVELQQRTHEVSRYTHARGEWLFGQWLLLTIFDCPETRNEMKFVLKEIKEQVARMALVPFSSAWVKQVAQDKGFKLEDGAEEATASAFEFVRRIFDLPEEMAELRPYSSFLSEDFIQGGKVGFHLGTRPTQGYAYAYHRFVADLPDFKGEYFVCHSAALGSTWAKGERLRTTPEPSRLPGHVFLDDAEGMERLTRELRDELCWGARIYTGGFMEKALHLPTKLSLQRHEGRYVVKTLSTYSAQEEARAIFQRGTGEAYPRGGSAPASLKLSSEAIDEILGVYAWHVKRYGELWDNSFYGKPMTDLILGRGNDARKALIERIMHQDRANSNAFTHPLMHALLSNTTVNKVKVGVVTRTCLDALVAAWDQGKPGHEDRLREITHYFLCMAIDRVLGGLLPQNLLPMLPVASAFEQAKLGALLREGKTHARHAEECGVSREKHPLLWQAFADGMDSKILYMPEHGGKTPINREFRLWETMFRRGHGEEIKEIVDYVASRVNYSRRITQYFAAMLRLEAWLDRYAPREGGWRVNPKIVTTTSDELQETEGVSKRRSAMTPTVHDGVVLLPFVTIRESGGCAYSEEYVISDVGVRDIATRHGGVFDVPFEEKLNGRDDYGLLYYTLTGTTEFSGYPTFLIILEHLEGRKRVHFHRVSPCRRIGGQDTATPDLIPRCYQYMTGNIPASEIDFQQGDLIFVRDHGKPLVDPILVDQYEGHAFDPPILHVAGDGEGNFLGTLEAKERWSLLHQEHAAHRDLPPGRWKLYRCKSFERNPTGSFRRFVD